MRAAARLSVARETPGQATGRTRITGLRSDPPLLLRPTHPGHVTGPLRKWFEPLEPAAWVSLAASAAGPVGGDDFHLDIDVGAGAVLVLRAVAATIALPGPHGLPSRSQVDVHVAEQGTLVWLPDRLIAAHGCEHHAITRVELEHGTRLFVRDELILGRHGEQPGTVSQHLRVCVEGEPLHDQELTIGPDEPGWDGPAITAGHRAVGSQLVVDPDRVPVPGIARPADAAGADVAVMSLAGPASLVTALAPDATSLRRCLDAHP